MSDIFVSHAVADEDLAKLLVDFIKEAIGVPSSAIFCSSVKGHNIPLGENFNAYIKQKIKMPKLVILLMTPAYMESAFCLMELGAAWAQSSKNLAVVVPPIGYETVTKTFGLEQAWKITSKTGLVDLRATVRGTIENLEPRPDHTWDEKRTQWEIDLAKALSKLQQAKKVGVDENARGTENKPNSSPLEGDAVILRSEYPGKYRAELQNADELWMSGTNLRRIVDRGGGHFLNRIERVVAKGGKVKVLMHHWEDDACENAFDQDPAQTKSLPEYRELIRTNLEAFIGRKNKTPLSRENLTIRTLNYMMGFGLDILNLRMDEVEETVEPGRDYPLGKTSLNEDGHSDNWKRGVVYVRFYPLPPRGHQLDDRPILRLTYKQDFWYTFFISQFLNHWHLPPRGWAEDRKF